MKHIHLIGIGGTGLSAIARLLKERGFIVSGSDRAMSPLARQLAEDGIQVFVGHQAENIAGADVVVRSSAVQLDNPEVQAAEKAGIPVLKRSDFLGQVMSGMTGIAIAGTHGKTTTTAMMAWTLYRLDQDPTYIIGGVSKNLGNNAHAGTGNTFVIEADEYDRMFLGLQPEITILNNLEHDHPDCFPTMADYEAAFEQFVRNLKPGGLLLACADEPHAAALAARQAEQPFRTLTFGFSENAMYQGVNMEVNQLGGFDFQMLAHIPGREANILATVQLQVPGLHNVGNALAVLAVIDQLGLSLEQAAQALSEFTGTGRRFDILGTVHGITIIDDYAHHPTEVRATLSAARSRYPHQSIWAVWQPHTFSRTMTLLKEFTQAFQLADQVIVTEIYAAREHNDQFSARQVVEQMNHASCCFIPTLAETSHYLLEHLQSGDILLVLSAGDADQISASVLIGLQNREDAHA